MATPASSVQAKRALAARIDELSRNGSEAIVESRRRRTVNRDGYRAPLPFRRDARSGSSVVVAVALCPIFSTIQ